MQIETLHKCVYDSNWFKLTPQELNLLSAIEGLIGGNIMAEIFENLSIKGSFSGAEFKMYPSSQSERAQLSTTALHDLRQQFIIQLFKKLFSANKAGSKKIPEIECRMLADWCHNDPHEISLMIENVLGSNQYSNRCREFLKI